MPSKPDEFLISEMIYRIFCTRPLEEIAPMVGKHANTIRNELNPNNPQYKNGFNSVVDYMDFTGEFFELVNWLANRYSHHLVPNPQACPSPEHLNRLLTETTKVLGRLSEVYLDATDPSSPGGVEITEEERERILRKVQPVKHIINQIESKLRK